MPTDWDPLSVQAFVRTTLGCTCPDEVLSDVELNPDCRLPGFQAPLVRILLGRRLLVYVLREDDPATLARNLQVLFAEGLAERNRNGYNRLRVVLDTVRPAVVQEAAQKAFTGFPARDERVHLHVLDARVKGSPPWGRPTAG